MTISVINLSPMNAILVGRVGTGRVIATGLGGNEDSARYVPHEQVGDTLALTT